MEPINIHVLNMNQMIALYERYLQNPASVDDVTRAIFDNGSLTQEIIWDGHKYLEQTQLAGRLRYDEERLELSQPINPLSLEKIIASINYVHAIRTYGHLNVQLDPLGCFPIRW